MRLYNFPVLITQDEDGVYMARVPTLSGCHTQAKSLPVLYRRIEEAIALCMKVECDKKNIFSEERFIGVQQIQVSI